MLSSYFVDVDKRRTSSFRRPRMDDDDYRTESEVEYDSDHDDQDAEQELGQWIGQLESLKMCLEPGDTGTVRRRNKTVVTPKMAMESFRFSFLNSDEAQDVNFDAILGELCELETQLSTTQSELSRSHGSGMSSGLAKDEHRDSGNDLAQAELDALATEITQTFGYRHSVQYGGDHEFLHGNFISKHGSCSDLTGETDSAFSENASLPSSESFTSMVTVSSSAETSSGGDTSSTASSASTITPLSMQASEMHEMLMSQLSLYEEQLELENHPLEEQRARIKAEKIRIALEKIKEAKIRKLFVRAFAKDGSSKSILVDEKMSIGQVCSTLADKNHVRVNSKLSVVEHMPDLFMERILEDHDSLVENMVMWTRDSKNKIMFEERQEKYDLFRRPEKYLLVSSSSEKGASLDPSKRQRLIYEFFTGGAQVPEVEGVMYLKSDGKKAWKKFFFVLRASGLYYNPKGKISKSSKDLTCLVQFDFVDVYFGLGWKKKYHAPTDHCFALKHPQIQKKTSKYIRYFCTENKAALDQWVMGIRIAKYGKQLLANYERLQREVASWDTRDLRSSISDDSGEAILNLNIEGNLNDSRISMPEISSRHSIVAVKNTNLVRNSSGSDSTIVEDDVSLEVTSSTTHHHHHHHERKSSLTGQHSMEMGGMPKQPVKRVSFSNTHSVINADSGEELVHVRHRDSITSASTDSSEDSNSSGENRHTMTSSRSKMRAKLPVTTGTTRQISEMYQTAMEGSSVSSCDSMGHERKPSITSPVQTQDKERRKSAPVLHEDRVRRHERKGSDGSRDSRESRDSRDSKSLSQSLDYTSIPSNPSSKNTSPQNLHALNKVPPSPPPLKCPTQPYPTCHPVIPPSPSSSSQAPPLKLMMPTSPPPQREMVSSPPPYRDMMSPPPHSPYSRDEMMSPPPLPYYGKSQGRAPPVPPPPTSIRMPQPLMSPPVKSRPAPPQPPHQNYPQHPNYPSQHFPQPPSPAPMPSPPVSANKSPPPPMPPPGHMTKPPSPLPLSQPPLPPPPTSMLQTHISMAQSNLADSSSSHLGSGSPTPSTMSSPSTPKGMVPMPPPMPLLQNQYVGGQSASGMGHIRRSSKSGSETVGASPSKAAIPVAPPTPPTIINHSVSSPTVKNPKHTQVMSTSDPMMGGSGVRTSLPESTSSPQIPQHIYGGHQGSYQSGHHGPHQGGQQVPYSSASQQDNTMYDQIRVRPGPQARTTHSCNVPPPPPPVSMAMPRPHSSAGVRSQSSHSEHMTPLSPSQEEGIYAQQQPLPFLAELSKRPHQKNRGSNGKIPPATLPKPTEQSQSKTSNGASYHGGPHGGPNHQGHPHGEPLYSHGQGHAHQGYSHGEPHHQGQLQGGHHHPSNGPAVPPRPNSVNSNKGGTTDNKKLYPPPPPKRSETTRLSSELPGQSEGSAVSNIDPIYETFEECEGMLDINDLPPPPPELLAGLDNPKDGSVGKKGKPPPPPPKRNKDTQLTVQ
ncbi:ras-associated and pleckstrin homology domains-containing protein 1-like isoform X2 [Pecten maximus]|uniref:ras-associated and pleckstrin homology domains-containing protein 1-like isoform X2 n=1 Tax=Pecten maximus TaxID=6579 RepID=UPI0014580D31|nr:ras-associated and pleckstrin homology domains-containing protein 1-like isoform X2 [Pecten maximus]